MPAHKVLPGESSSSDQANILPDALHGHVIKPSGGRSTPLHHPHRSDYIRSFWISSRAGAVFGIVMSTIFTFTVRIPGPLGLFYLAITLGAAIFSGLAGLGGAYLDVVLQKHGVVNEKKRGIITFGTVALITIAITYLGGALSGSYTFGSDLQNLALWGTLAGVSFGAVFAFVTFRSEMTRQKMMMLEMQNQHLTAIAQREQLLREAARNLAITEERNRMARELHDSINQGMHGIIYSLRALRGVLDGNERGLAILGHMEETADNTLKELRHLVMELSPSSLEEGDLIEALRLHCDLYRRRQQVDLELSMNYKGGLHPDQEMTVYRIVQESLANTQQHAAANHIKVSLQEDGGRTVLRVQDDGVGFDTQAAAGSGHGLTNMATRVRQSGGQLHIESQPGQGTLVQVVFDRDPNQNQ